MDPVRFEWDDRKNAANLAKHHVSFFEAQLAFADPHRVIARDLAHGGRGALLLLRRRRGRRDDCPFHVSPEFHPHHRRRLLAQREGPL